MQGTKDNQISQSAVGTTPIWWSEEIKPVTVSEPNNTVKQLERALSFILSTNQFDEFQLFCIQQALQKGGAV